VAGWRFRLSKKEQGHRGLLLEGWASPEGTREEVEFFLFIGPDYGTADVHSLRTESFSLIDYFSGILGEPASGAHPVNIGELMDSEDEIPVNAFWKIRETERGHIIERLLTAVGEEEIGDGE
jgi:hypothetical protein